MMIKTMTMLKLRYKLIRYGRKILFVQFKGSRRLPESVYLIYERHLKTRHISQLEDLILNYILIMY
jgi:hypothetical protein